MRKVAIVGGGPTRNLAPFFDHSWEIWAFSSRDENLARVTQWFEIHALKDLEEQLAEPRAGRRTFDAYMRYLQQLKVPVYMQEEHPDFPTSVRFPVEPLLEEFGRCFTSTVSYLIALAIHERVDVIGLWGVNLLARSGYSRQRPAVRYLLGVAHQRRIAIYLPSGCAFKVPKRPKFIPTKYLYAYDWEKLSVEQRRAKSGDPRRTPRGRS